jgi:hypothetical protein
MGRARKLFLGQQKVAGPFGHETRAALAVAPVTPVTPFTPFTPVIFKRALMLWQRLRRSHKKMTAA